MIGRKAIIKASWCHKPELQASNWFRIKMGEVNVKWDEGTLSPSRVEFCAVGLLFLSPLDFDGLLQDYSNSIANALDLLQYRT